MEDADTETLPSKPHKRPEPREPLDELIALRKKKGFGPGFFADQLGITRLHVTSIEQGRRMPSIELAARWLALLAPEAKVSMFGPLPHVERRIRAVKTLQKLAPELFKAA